MNKPFDITTADINPVLSRLENGVVNLRNLSAVAYDLAKTVIDIDRFEGIYGETEESHKLVVLKCLETLVKNLPFPLSEQFQPKNDVLTDVSDAVVDSVEDAYAGGYGSLFDIQNGLPFVYTREFFKPFVSPSGRKYALKKGGMDSRDVKLSLSHVTLPLSVDLRTSPKFPPVLDQGQAGTCAAHAAANALHYLLDKNKLEDWFPSRLFIYYTTRVYVEHTRPQDDTGVSIRDVCKAVQKYHVPEEKYMPYDDHKIAMAPSAMAVANANKHKTIAYNYVSQNLLSIKNVLAQQFPIMVGIQVFASLETEEVMKTGTVKMPSANEPLYGGHAVLLVGYDDATQTFTFMNSWGEGVGQKGFFSIPYQYITNPELASDLWVFTNFK